MLCNNAFITLKINKIFNVGWVWGGLFCLGVFWEVIGVSCWFCFVLGGAGVIVVGFFGFFIYITDYMLAM